MIVISKHLLRLSAVLVVAVGASACSSIPDWVDPTTWGSDQQASVPSEDQSGNQTATDQNGEGKTVAEASDTGATYPTLADTPDHAPQTTSSDDQKQVASGLVADRSQAQYSGDALRGGTEAAAPPPGPAPTAEQVAAAEAQASASTSASDSASASGAAPAGPDTDAAPNPNSTIDANPDQAPAATAGAQAATPDTSANAQVAAVEQPTAPTAPPPSSNAEPAVPAIAPGSTAAAPMASADASLGFRRSSAPPLDPSIAQFVPPSVLSRYQQTASEGAVPGIGSTSASGSYTAASMPKRTRTARHRTVSENVGGPEAMSGAVVANFESLQSSPAKSAAVYSDSRGVPPAEVVFFPHDTTVLNAQGREQVRQAVEAFRGHGGQGFIRVVGHSSSRTANMTVERHMVYNFERSQARANAVARALIAAGVPADKVLVEAVGDTQPVYYESMPQGEEGNRRAEIFLQS
ncbi:MAG TPA: OmpA family protein [Rhizomicrobium sp.]|jgi:outer membrane protein OmpA-like peptidoglycan-associated protein